MIAFATVSLRLMGVWLIVTAAPLLWALFNSIATLAGLGALHALTSHQVATSLVPVLLGALLVGSSKAAANWLVPSDLKSGDQSLTDQGLLRAGTQLIGLWLLVTAITTITTLVTTDITATALWFSQIVQVLLAAGLMFASRR